MRNTAANFCKKFSLKICLVILKEDLLFRVNVLPVASDNRVTSQGCFKSLVELNYFFFCTRFTLGKSQWKTGILLKMDIYTSEDVTFDTSKPGNFDSLRDNFYYETVILKLIEEESPRQNKVLWLFFTFFR